MKQLIKSFIASILALSFLLLSASVVSAISDPDSGPTVESIHIYRHVLETDDMFVLVQYYLDYTSNPDETITQAFLGRFMNGTTELANVMPYSFFDKGYNHGIFSMYLSTSDAPTWEGVYTIRFEGNPTLDWLGTPPSTTATTLSWHSTTTASATEFLLSSRIISIANLLSDYWSISLTTETAGGVKLSSYGEQYFTSAITNLRTMCPNIFSASVEAPIYESVVYEQTYRDTLLGRWDNTMTGRALEGLATWTTAPLTVVKGLLWFIAVGIIAFYISTSVGDPKPALFLVLLTLPLGNLLGMLSLTFTVMAGLISIIALGWVLFYQRAT